MISKNKILKKIKYFPPSTRSSDVHTFFALKTVREGSEELFQKFAFSRLDDLIAEKLFMHEDLLNKENETKNFATPFDKIPKYLN